MVKRFLFVFCLFFANPSLAKSEFNLKVLEVGAWSTGNSILYIKLNREIGPPECTNQYVKVYIGKDGDTESALAAVSMIRSMALSALAADLDVWVNTVDGCVHGNPSIDRLYVRSNNYQ